MSVGLGLQKLSQTQIYQTKEALNLEQAHL